MLIDAMKYDSWVRLRKPKTLTLFPLIWFLSISISMVFYFYLEPYGLVLFTISFLSAVTVFIYLFEQVHNGDARRNILSVFFILLFFVVFALRGIVLSFDINMVRTPNFVEFRTLILAMCYALLGLGCFIIGFHFILKPRLPEKMGRFFFQRRFALFGLYVFAFLGISGQIVQALFYYSSVPAIAYVGGIPGYMNNLGLLSVGLLSVRGDLRANKSRLFFCAVFILIYLLLSFVRGQRSAVINLMIYAGIYLVLTKQFRLILKDKRVMLSIIGLCVFFVFLYPIISIYKGYSGHLIELSGKERFTESYELYRLLLESKINAPFNEKNNLLTNLSSRTGSGLDLLALLIARTPEVWDFQYGKTILLIPLTFVPRALWLDKPEMTMAGRFYEEYYGYSRLLGKGAAGYTMVGDFYLNFHLAGIICGMFIFGIFCRAFQVFCLGFDFNKANAAGILFFALNVLPLINQTSTVSDAIGGLLIISLVILPLLVIIGKRVRM